MTPGLAVRSNSVVESSMDMTVLLLLIVLELFVVFLEVVLVATTQACEGAIKSSRSVMNTDMRIRISILTTTVNIHTNN
jgi:hypothetical protein